MSICDNATVNQEIPLKLQSIRKTKTCRNSCKITFNDPKIKKVPRYFSTWYCPPLYIIRYIRGAFKKYAEFSRDQECQQEKTYFSMLAIKSMFFVIE